MLEEPADHLQDLEPQLYKYGQPSVYGGFQDRNVIMKPPTVSYWRRRRLNLMAIALCFFGPWLLFCFLYAITTFSLFYRSPALVFFIVFVAFLAVVMLGMKALDAVKRRLGGDSNYEPTWHIFLFITSLIAWFVAIYAGYHNFHFQMNPYYGIQNLGNYNGVSPTNNNGQQFMDAGRIVFEKGAHLDLSKSMSFKNDETYCVAPIVSANYSLDGAPETYDFWAVGLNCCCGDTLRTANFQCGEFNNPTANAGVRLMRDDERPFYRLAVQQAVGAFGIKAKHPLFFHWVQNAVASTESYRWEGHRRYLIGVYLYFLFQLVLTVLAAACFTRMEQ